MKNKKIELCKKEPLIFFLDFRFKYIYIFDQKSYKIIYNVYYILILFISKGSSNGKNWIHIWWDVSSNPIICIRILLVNNV